MEWYKNWFNSEEYLKVYRHRDQKEANELVQLVIKNIDVSKVKNVLDMAAGSGRHAIIFTEKGFNVTAVDLSENLLSIGRKNAEKLNEKVWAREGPLTIRDLKQRFDISEKGLKGTLA